MNDAARWSALVVAGALTGCDQLFELDEVVVADGGFDAARECPASYTATIDVASSL